MANPVHYPYHLLIFMLFISSFHHSNQLLQSPQYPLLVIHQLLGYPSFLSSFKTTTDFCNLEPTPSLTLVCYEDKITQLHIIGNSSIPPLPQNFSIDSLFTALAALSNLKVLSLVSLGLWGPLPATVGQLSSLEIFNVSSNHLNGVIPEQLSSLRDLQTLILDHNEFTGQVPSWLSSLPVLAVLSLKNNSLSGFLPKSMALMENLRILSVSNNHLSGEVPDLQNLTNLQIVDLQDNSFGPHFPSLHSNLVTLVLRNNSFQYGIPAELVSFYQLQRLDISMNGFVGPFLPAILSLPSLTYIDISENKFTGKLVANMSCNLDLVHIDLSSNLLSGDLPTCLKSGSKMRIVQYANNCLSNREQKQHPSIVCQNEALAVKPHEKEKQSKRRSHDDAAVLASGTIGGTIGAITIVGLVSLVFRRVYGKLAAQKLRARVIMEDVSSTNPVKLLSDARYISQTMKLGATLPAYRTFALEELKEATSNFENSYLLGDYSHSKIYRGKLRDETLVAIRSLTVKKKQCQQNITHQIELISKLRHSHVVSALGHCFDCGQDDSSTSRIFLIFEFVPNGTLREHTSGLPGKKMNWKQRIGAAIGVAKGIQFLHTGVVPGVYSSSLKITDVLLDHDFHAKVSRYNLPLLADSRGMMGAPAASPGPKQCILTRHPHVCACSKRDDDDKKDVYDLGVILVEIIVGRPINSHDEVIVVKDLLQVSISVDDTARRSIVDPAVRKECADDSLKIMMEICIRCLSDKPSDRPSVEGVLWNLHFAAQVQESRKGGESQNNEESHVSCSQV